MVTSNHGQEFNETQSNSWGYGNYSTYQVQVPWCWPGLVPNLPQAQASSHLDLVPTLMKNMLGVRNPIVSTGTGRNLFKPVHTWLLAGSE